MTLHPMGDEGPYDTPYTPLPVCSHEGRYDRAHDKDVKLRPSLEGPQQMLCAPCWDDYDAMVYRMWESHVG